MSSIYGLSVADLDCINKHFAWRVTQQLEIGLAPMSNSVNVIMELLSIKFNSLYMFLLNTDVVTFILDFFLCIRRDDCNFFFLFRLWSRCCCFVCMFNVQLFVLYVRFHNKYIKVSEIESN